MLDPLSSTATVNVMGTTQRVHITGNDISRAASFARQNREKVEAVGRFAYKHRDKVDVKLGADGNVTVDYVPPSSRAPPPSPHAKAKPSRTMPKIHTTGRNSSSSSSKPGLIGRRYIRMVGHEGIQAERMGVYVEHPEKAIEGYSAYKHMDGDWYLYYYKRNKFWFIGSRIGKRAGWLYVQSEEKYPDSITKPWRYWDDNGKKWLVDKKIACVHVIASELTSSQAKRKNVLVKSEPQIDTTTLQAKRLPRRHSADDILHGDIFADSELKESWFAALFTLYSSNPDF